jgi:hypothetical protein
MKVVGRYEDLLHFAESSFPAKPMPRELVSGKSAARTCVITASHSSGVMAVHNGWFNRS